MAAAVAPAVGRAGEQATIALSHLTSHSARSAGRAHDWRGGARAEECDRARISPPIAADVEVAVARSPAPRRPAASSGGPRQIGPRARHCLDPRRVAGRALPSIPALFGDPIPCPPLKLGESFCSQGRYTAPLAAANNAHDKRPAFVSNDPGSAGDEEDDWHRFGVPILHNWKVHVQLLAELSTVRHVLEDGGTREIASKRREQAGEQHQDIEYQQEGVE
eukprot:CAMPEP_0118971746 /NCGR_PEP_ID=MMETSP1173-20130426/8285_1 /TAXON_ID=1034831 /ORGANISM="Rhizochromulina marina cf, Strain CCMP1243" /LENGTH=219 /DNA_ID=CAMNT_0006921231 /DNA_START=577 /DNA_END=1238 /DNA_ORIENTATION=+